MRKKTSMNICKNFSKVWFTGDDISQIMTKESDYYNVGIYGWNCNLWVDYEHDSIICAGYRNMKGKMIPRELIGKYQKLVKVWHKKAWTTREWIQREQIQADFLKELNSLEY